MKSFRWCTPCAIVLFASLLTNCTKDEAPLPPAKTDIITKPVIVSPDGGMTMTAEIKS
jgi:hypothetical protein